MLGQNYLRVYGQANVTGAATLQLFLRVPMNDKGKYYKILNDTAKLITKDN